MPRQQPERQNLLQEENLEMQQMGNQLGREQSMEETPRNQRNMKVEERRESHKSISEKHDWDTLKQYVISNDLVRLTRDFLNECKVEDVCKVVLDACEKKGNFTSVEDGTTEFLLNNCIDYINEAWYGWELIHYAAAVSIPEILKKIVGKLEKLPHHPNKINTLTMLSENALHILLEHSSLSKFFSVSCQNGQDLMMFKVMNQEPNDVIECARILIEANIDINHSNFWNETPILIAIKRRYFNVVDLLLNNKKVDLDFCRDAVSGKTARELLQGKENLGILPAPSATKPTKILFHLLKSGDVEGFVKFNGGKICDLVNQVDGDNEPNSSCTLLQYCFRRGLIFWHQAKTTESDHFSYPDITASQMVQVFCQSGMAKCVQHLLDNKADVDFRLTKFEGRLSVLEAAIVKGYYPFAALIMGHSEFKLNCKATDDVTKNNLKKKLFKAMVKLVEAKNICPSDLNYTLSVVLTKLIEVNNCDCLDEETQTDLKTILEKGVRIINKDNLLLLLKFPGSLCLTDNSPGEKCCDQIKLWYSCQSKFWCCCQKKFWCCCQKTKSTILEKIDPEVLKTHLNDCVDQEGEDFVIKCHSFIQDKSMLPVFETFSSSPVLKESLRHIVFKIWIMRHWNHLRFQGRWFKMKYFDVNFWFYLFFYFFLNVFIVCKFNGASYEWLRIIGLVCLGIFALKEVSQLCAKFRTYFTELSNYFEWFFIVVTLIVYCLDGTYIDIAEVLSILAANIVLLLLLLNVPKCSKYIIILKTILYYLRFFLFYLIQFIAFAICFYILFSKKDQFYLTELPNKFFETVILFTGNLDYMETPWKSDNNSSGNSTDSTFDLFHDFPGKEIFSKVIFIIFVLFLAIILQNLLLGLLVVDISNLHNEGALAEQIKRAKFIVRLDKFFESCCLRFLSKYIFRYKRMEVEMKVTVDDKDRKTLTEEEKQTLDFILTKKVKAPNVLTKLRKYIKARINERNVESRNDKSKEIVDRLAMIEEIVKNFHDELQEIKKNS